MNNLKIAHLYPDVLNLYGDLGNIRCMQKRLEWRGIGCEIESFPIGRKCDFAQFDLFFIGGGQDFEQTLLLEDLHTGKDKELCAAIEDGKTFLTICGGYQLLGEWYETADGQRCEYLGALPMHTTGSHNRMIGNYAFRLPEEMGGSIVLGFENHGGRTELGTGVSPLGTVLKGYGNNGMDGTEGIHYKNTFGTYSHGPVLPKNPDFCDLILSTALRRKYGDGFTGLQPLDDSAEDFARAAVLKKLELTGK